MNRTIFGLIVGGAGAVVSAAITFVTMKVINKNKKEAATQS